LDIPATHEITSVGRRTAYVPSELPVAFDDDATPTDFGDYENLRNCTSGLAYIFDQHMIAIRAVDSDPQAFKLVGRGRIELPTRRFSVFCSTD
jgi:hypothetical protein